MPKDACYHKVVARYGPKTSAYRSGAMAKCRKVGAANWGNKSKKEKGGLAASLMSDVYGSGRKLKKRQNGGQSNIGPKSAKRFRENPFPGPAFTKEQEAQAARARKKVKRALKDPYGTLRKIGKKIKKKLKMKNGGVSKVKGVSTEGLTSRQATTLKKHSVHHTRKHIQSMVNAMKKGASFSASHKMAQKKVGS
tara:strand:+ start:162 stop:743 length:582 start_codon:yes stop_codon:yes gene_type:complete